MRLRYERFRVQQTPEGFKITLKQRGNILGVNLFFLCLMIIGIILYWSPSLRTGFTYGLISFLILEIFCSVFIGFGIYAWFYKCEWLITKKEFKRLWGFRFVQKEEIISISEIKEIRGVTYQGQQSTKAINFASTLFPYRIELVKNSGEEIKTGFDFRSKKSVEEFTDLLKIYLSKPTEYTEKQSNY